MSIHVSAKDTKTAEALKSAATLLDLPLDQRYLFSTRGVVEATAVKLNAAKSEDEKQDIRKAYTILRKFLDAPEPDDAVRKELRRLAQEANKGPHRGDFVRGIAQALKRDR